MAFSDELIRASQAFKESMQGLAQQRAFSRAQDQIDQIRQSEQDALEKRRQTEQLSRQLSQDLLAAGASPTQAAFAKRTFAPKQAPTGQERIREAFTLPEGEARQRAVRRGQRQQFTQAGVGQQLKLEQLGAKIGADLQKMKLKELQNLSKEQRKETRKEIRGFSTRTGVKEQLGALAALQGTRRAIETGSPAAPSIAARTLLRFAGEKGRFTDRDVDAMNVNPAVKNDVKRLISRKGLNRALEEDLEAFTEIFEALEEGTRESVRKQAVSAASIAKDIPGINKEQLAKRLINSVDTSVQTQAERLLAAPRGIGAQQQEQEQGALGPTPGIDESPEELGFEF